MWNDSGTGLMRMNDCCDDCWMILNASNATQFKNHVLNGKDWKVGLTKVFMKGACYEKSENSLFFKSRWTLNQM